MPELIINGRGDTKTIYTAQESSVPAKLLKETKSFNADEIAVELGVGVDVVKATIEKLQATGYGFARVGDEFIRSKAVSAGGKFDAREFFATPDKRFGVCSDTHLSSKQERVDLIDKFYDHCAAEGLTVIFHVGDITDGYGVYKGQEFELKHLGQEEQIAYAVATYPRRDGITTIAISGNHDMRQYQKGGVDPLVAISQQRPDIIYTGVMQSEVQLDQNVRVEMLHPDGGQAYALSYKAQRNINAREARELPDILLFGHYHTSFYMFYRGVHFLQVPCLKDAGIWEKRNGMNTVLGGWVVESHIGELGKIDKLTPQLVTYK